MAACRSAGSWRRSAAAPTPATHRLDRGVIARAAQGLALAACLFATGTIARAEDETPLPAWHVGPYFGTAHNSPGGVKWGAIPDRDHYFIGVRGSAPVLRLGGFTLAYSPEVAPLLVITNNPTYRTITVIRGGATRRVQVENGSGLVAGAGIAPLGSEGILRLTPHLRVFCAASVGVIWFTREVPVANSKAYNYTSALGGGFLWEFRARRRLRFGYMFHHLSNAWSAVENPGLDGDVFYVGWEALVGGPRAPETR